MKNHYLTRAVAGRQKQALACAAAGFLAAPLQAQTFPEPASSQAMQEAQAATLTEVHVIGSTLEMPIQDASTPVHYLGPQELLQRRAGNLGETLEGLPGVRNNNYGAGAGRPVIRGADGARVQILSDGSEVMDVSTSSPDHAVGLEPMLATEVEILRGPSTLIYGGGITGGVVNVIDNRVPTSVPENGYAGTVELRRETGARENTGLFSLTGGHGPFALNIEGLKRDAHDYRVGRNWEHSRVEGSYNNTWYGSIGGSLVLDQGYIGVAYNRLRSKYGLPGHSHEYEDCHLHGDHLHCGSHGHGHGHDEDGAPPGCHWHGTMLHCPGGGHGHDHDHVAMVDMDTKRWDLRGQYENPLPGFSRARLRASLTDYHHDEIDHGEIGTSFYNHAHDIRLDLEHQRFAIGAGHLRGLIGVQHSNRDFEATGAEAFVDPNRTRRHAVYALEEYRIQDWRFELGGRYEWQKATLDGTHRRGAVRHRMGSVSSGATWSFTPGYALAFSASRTERGPTAEELFASGIHLATNTWERGDPNLKAERSNNFDISLRKVSGATRFDVTAFYNRIDNYIYADTVDRYQNFRLIDYTQRDATFKGAEGRLSRQIHPQWRVGLFGDTVRASFKGGGNVPRVPAHRLGTDASWAYGRWSAGGEFYRNFSQNRLAHYETRTPHYDMLNLQIGWLGSLGQSQSYELYARLHNALDKLAFNHSSFVRDASPLRGRSLMLGVKADF